MSNFRTMMTRSELNNSTDFFRTPELTTLCLLSQRQFGKNVWEPACGDGAISKLLCKVGEYAVLSTDLNRYGYDFANDGLNFLESDVDKYSGKFDIVTNPPYNIHLEWIERSLQLARRYVALLFPLIYLTPKNKRNFITNRCGFELIVPGWRSKFVMPGKSHAGGMKDYAWFVWDKNKPASKSFKTTVVDKAEVEILAKKYEIDYSIIKDKD